MDCFPRRRCQSLNHLSPFRDPLIRPHLRTSSDVYLRYYYRFVVSTRKISLCLDFQHGGMVLAANCISHRIMKTRDKSIEALVAVKLHDVCRLVREYTDFRLLIFLSKLNLFFG